MAGPDRDAGPSLLNRMGISTLGLPEKQPKFEICSGGNDGC
jgi:hypothetical protein